MERNRNLGWIFLWGLIGLIIGGILGESLGYIFGKLGEMSGGSADNPIRNLFVRAWELNLGFEENGWVLDLSLIKLRLGLAIKFNFCSLLGLMASWYLLKWYRN